MPWILEALTLQLLASNGGRQDCGAVKSQRFGKHQLNRIKPYQHLSASVAIRYFSTNKQCQKLSQ